MSRWKPLPSRERIIELFDYNPETGAFLWRNGPNEGLQAGGTTFKVRVDGSGYRVHRLIFKLMTDQEPIDIDHRDGDPTNNRWKNLREATYSQQAINTKLKMTNTSGVRGVLVLPNGRFRAIICFQRKRYNLGNYDSLTMAAEARQKAEENLHGEWRRTLSSGQETL